MHKHVTVTVTVIVIVVTVYAALRKQAATEFHNLNAVAVTAASEQRLSGHTCTVVTYTVVKEKLHKLA